MVEKCSACVHTRIYIYTQTEGYLYSIFIWLFSLQQKHTGEKNYQYIKGIFGSQHTEAIYLAGAGSPNLTVLYF